jgi:DNA-binding beta-propeller fold protein YncE
MRKRNEKHFSGGYLTEDHTQVANLPQNVVYRPYGDPVGILDQDIDDTIYGIDTQRMRDFKKARESWDPRKV